ncbi:ESF1 homolog [Drosophila tropicalis]|uniref:ESF1 homolog n=1 Tax=Drosophila tropicalis TaxID=46794 RepID=UPI0035AB93D9
MAKDKEKKAKLKGKPKEREPEKAKSFASSTALQVPTNGNGEASTSGIWQDSRFQHLLADPRFRGVPKVQRKVKIDKRFEGMFTDDKFKVKYTVDKYGRPINKSNAEDLKKFYELDESDEEDDNDDVEKEKEDVAKEGEVEEDDEEAKERRLEELALVHEDRPEKDDFGNDLLDSDGSEEIPETLRQRLTNPNIDYARGEGRLMSDSSSDDDTEAEGDDEGPELQIDHVWGELDNDAETTEESTKRLAICNMDWDRIRAEDLMVLLSSFLPLGGSVLSVKIYPSEFGKKRIAEEDMHGPTELIKKSVEDDDENVSDDDDEEEEDLVKEQDSDAEEGDNYHMEKLREYQLNRLRYYYAVVELDSVETADKIYKECDGIEYESSATRMDLRFIPDDTTFDEDEPTQECNEMPDSSSYKPRQFTTTALQQAKVDLTWDETNLERKELGDKLSSGKVDKLNDKELRQIVNYSSEEDDDDDDEVELHKDIVSQPEENVQKPEEKKKLSKKERIEKYRSLLAEINEQETKSKGQKYEMEMSWQIEDPAVEQKVKEEKSESKQNLTPIEKVIQKRSEKNKQRKEQRRQRQIEANGGVNGDNSDSDSIPDGIDMNDAYFAEEFASGDYQPAKTKKSTKKQKNKTNRELDEDEQKQEQELALLLDDADADEKQHFSLTKILKEEQSTEGSKRKRRKQLKKAKNQKESKEPEDNFKLNLDDSRFKAVYKSHEYNIDPTHSHYKATKGMQEIIGEKLKRRHNQVEKRETSGDGVEDEDQDKPKRSKQQLEQSALVKSLKMKLQQHKKL